MSRLHAASEDEQAFEQISALMPEYEGKIVTVEATDLIRHEGCLNCASWTVYEPELQGQVNII